MGASAMKNGDFPPVQPNDDTAGAISGRSGNKTQTAAPSETSPVSNNETAAILGDTAVQGEATVNPTHFTRDW